MVAAGPSDCSRRSAYLPSGSCCCGGPPDAASAPSERNPLMDGRGAWQPTRRELLRAAAVAGAGIAFAGPLSRGALAASSASYDDGTGSIPGGLEGEPERVIIVGAGWAGLTAANALRNAGSDHVVLEGRDRIGGRAHTVDLDGGPIHLGCSWI